MVKGQQYHNVVVNLVKAEVHGQKTYLGKVSLGKQGKPNRIDCRMNMSHLPM